VCGLGSSAARAARIENTSGAHRVLRKIRITHRSLVSFSAPSSSNVHLPPNSVVEIRIDFLARYIGLCRASFAFYFDGGFTVRRSVTASCGDAALHASLAPTTPYVRPPRNRARGGNRNFVHGARPLFSNSAPYKNKMAKHAIPADIDRFSSEARRRGLAAAGEARDRSLASGSDADVVRASCAFSAHLLYSEELQLEEDIKMYDIERTQLNEKNNAYLALTVPGLAEKRPSIMRGDHVLARRLRDGDGVGSTLWQGFVYQVEQAEVLLRFDRAFHARHTQGEAYEVSFTFARRGMRLMLQGLKLCAESDVFRNILHPDSEASARYLSQAAAALPAPPPLAFINRDLNAQQRQAVQALAGRARGCERQPPSVLAAFRNLFIGERRDLLPTPYIIFGPPGTGECAITILTLCILEL
jgi:helicase MOV-10